jgi:hypothetical protein
MTCLWTDTTAQSVQRVDHGLDSQGNLGSNTGSGKGIFCPSVLTGRLWGPICHLLNVDWGSLSWSKVAGTWSWHILFFCCQATIRTLTFAVVVRGESGKYRSFAIRVSRHKIWHFCVIGIERNVCRCSLNRHNLTQFANLSAGEQLCRRCTNRILEHFKTSNSLTPNDHYSDHTAPLTSKRCILYIYSTNISTE